MVCGISSLIFFLPQCKRRARIVDCGQTVSGGYDRSVRQELVTGPDGRAELSFAVPWAATDGVRAAVSDPVSGVRKSFFATLLPEPQLKRMRQSASHLSGKKHLLFIGDSLTDYDRGRNYPSLISCFMPKSWTLRNAGIGGDDLRRIYTRLTGGKVNRPEMYKNLFTPMPDIIFLLCGANDTKSSFKSGYKQNAIPEEIQASLLDQILSELKKNAPQARIVLISPLDSYQPSQKALAEPLAKAGINHSFFGDPIQIRRFTEKMKQAAKKHGLEFCDAGSIFRAAENLQQLHVPDDGVHLSLQGHQLMAEIVLDYLAGPTQNKEKTKNRKGKKDENSFKTMLHNKCYALEFYTYRTAHCNCDHRDFSRYAAACIEPRQAERTANRLSVGSETIWNCLDTLHGRKQFVVPSRMLYSKRDVSAVFCSHDQRKSFAAECFLLQKQSVQQCTGN